jgi:hypothetical protein
LTFTEGKGPTTKVSTGEINGSTPKLVGKYPDLNESDRGLVYSPRSKKYYFVRGTTLMEYDPATKTKKVVRSPVVAVQRGPGGVIIFVSPDRKVCQGIFIIIRNYYSVIATFQN